MINVSNDAKVANLAGIVRDGIGSRLVAPLLLSGWGSRRVELRRRSSCIGISRRAMCSMGQRGGRKCTYATAKYYLEDTYYEQGGGCGGGGGPWPSPARNVVRHGLPKNE